MIKNKYTPDLPAFMSCCEVNFLKLLKLLPADRDFDALNYKTRHTVLRIDVLETARYTMMIRLTKSPSVSVSGIKPISMDVRIYFDAKMAEVVNYQGLKKIKPVYSYPNKSMLHRDEKQQANEFLGEWLTFCLSQGYFSDKSDAALPQDLSS